MVSKIVSLVKDLLITREQKIENYIFQGGSVKGIAYIGALQALENDGIKLKNIKRIGGTSVGAIMGTLLSVGYDLEELNVELTSLNFQEFLDIKDQEIMMKTMDFFTSFRENIRNSSATYLSELHRITDGFTRIKKREVGKYLFDYNLFNFFGKRSFIKQTAEFRQLAAYIMNKQGLAEGEVALKWIERKIRNKTNIQYLTFGELNELHRKYPEKYKQLYLIGTNLYTQKSEIFSHEHTPNAIISDAVRISMSLPIVFRPHQYYEKKNNKRTLVKNDFYADGGLLDNYPIWLFDKDKYLTNNGATNVNKRTLGFRLESLKNIIINQTYQGCPQINLNMENEHMSNSDLVVSFLMCFYAKQDSDFNMQKEEHKDRTIFIEDRKISTLKFTLSDDDKKELIRSGKNGADEYVKNNMNTIKRDSIAEGAQFLLITISTVVLSWCCIWADLSR